MSPIPILKLRVKYSRSFSVSALSHIEAVNIIRNCVIKSGLPVCASGAARKKLRVSFGPPLPVGYASYCELFDMEMEKRVDSEASKTALSESCPEGFKIMSVAVVPVISLPVDSAANLSKYVVEHLPVRNGYEEELKRFFELKEFLIERITDKNRKIMDARPLVAAMKYNNNAVEIMLRFGPGRTVKPDIVLQKLFNLSDKEKQDLRITRMSFYREHEGGQRIEL
ncbi:MAG: hypothetical protein BWY26_00932 [Elusimicrobia bacterium ADurb.Bin231]|nr:MAG: hypothetical protein BWY26_00932 [Elusimicrobia bacterium ADurb.Bin231]